MMDIRTDRRRGTDRPVGLNDRRIFCRYGGGQQRMYKKRKDKKIYRVSDDRKEKEQLYPEEGEAVSDGEGGVSGTEGQPDAAHADISEEQKMEIYEQLLMDTFGYRIRQVGKSIISSIMMMSVGIAAVWFLMTPSAGDTVRETDTNQHSIVVVDDYTGEAKFVSADVENAFNANSDVVGWLRLDGCEIDNLVFQSVDNSYYLRKNEEGRYSIWGCYFMDFINLHSGATLYDRVTIIYGHSSGNSANGNKFSKIKRYRDEDFAREHPVITFSLLYREMKWEVFACTDMPVTINYIDPDPTDERYRETFGYMIDNSYVDFGIDLRDDDQILLLSTCTSDPYVRFVLAARLITED